MINSHELELNFVRIKLGRKIIIIELDRSELLVFLIFDSHNFLFIIPVDGWGREKKTWERKRKSSLLAWLRCLVVLLVVCMYMNNEYMYCRIVGFKLTDLPSDQFICYVLNGQFISKLFTT